MPQVLPRRHAWWMWYGRITMGILPLDRFLQGQTYFVRRLHEKNGVQPVHVHVTYNMGLNAGKRWRLRQIGHWFEPEEKRQARGGALLQVVGFDALATALLEGVFSTTTRESGCPTRQERSGWRHSAVSDRAQVRTMLTT